MSPVIPNLLWVLWSRRVGKKKRIKRKKLQEKRAQEKRTQEIKKENTETDPRGSSCFVLGPGTHHLTFDSIETTTTNAFSGDGPPTPSFSSATPPQRPHAPNTLS